jgi:hypothetical protein
MSTGLIRAVAVGTCLGVVGAVTSCELLVQLDRTAVDGGGPAGGDEGPETGDEEGGASMEAGPLDSGADSTDADAAETATADSGADTGGG